MLGDVEIGDFANFEQWVNVQDRYLVSGAFMVTIVAWTSCSGGYSGCGSRGWTPVQLAVDVPGSETGAGLLGHGPNLYSKKPPGFKEHFKRRESSRVY